MQSTVNWNEYDTEEMVRGDRDYLWHHIKPHKVFQSAEQMIIVEGKGLRVTDIRGREYLDATSGGVWSVMVGHGRESIAKAIYDQLITMGYYAGAFGNIPTIKFAAKLVELLPNLGPFADGFFEFPHALCYRCPFDKPYPGCNIDCARSVEDVILKEGPDTIGGCIVEPITAGGGIIVSVPEYYPILQEICNRYGIYLIMDEVVCGFGRTGKFRGFEQYDVDPDMVTMAKGLASSYMPLSATVTRQEIFDKFLCDPADPELGINYFRDISTYGGCAGATVAALESTRIIEEENLVENSRVVGAYMLESLQALSDMPLVGHVRGKGLFCGLELVKDKATKEPITEADMGRIMGLVAAEGVLIGRTNSSLPGNNTIMNFAPALIATKADIDEIVAAVKKAIEKF